jgi:CheY-like chemotaxis protein
MNNPDKKIAIIEEDYSNYYLLKTILNRINIDTIWLSDGGAAIDFFMNDFKDNIILILLDIKLPIKGGWEVAEFLKKTHPDIPVIAVTAYAMKGDAERILEAGCDDYLAKPFKKNDFLNLIAPYLATNGLLISKTHSL